MSYQTFTPNELAGAIDNLATDENGDIRTVRIRGGELRDEESSNDDAPRAVRTHTGELQEDPDRVCRTKAGTFYHSGGELKFAERRNHK